jgi:hypothetical protein
MNLPPPAEASFGINTFAAQKMQLKLSCMALRKVFSV